MDAHKESIWHGGSALEIMKEARKRFRVGDRINAHIGLASVHYSLIKRYMSGWKRGWAIWHGWRAIRNIRRALAISYRTFGPLTEFTADQIDVAARILTRVPKQLGGDQQYAFYLIESTLENPVKVMQPHTQALMLCTLGDITNNPEHYEKAIVLKEKILVEPDRLMARRQWVRIASTVGFAFMDLGTKEVAGKHSDDIFTFPGCNLVKEALYYARWPEESGEILSSDQVDKILAEVRKRGLDEGDLAMSIYPPD